VNVLGSAAYTNGAIHTELLSEMVLA
jgi:hypothetical protein